jgi:hypothetical protein
LTSTIDISGLEWFQIRFDQFFAGDWFNANDFSSHVARTRRRRVFTSASLSRASLIADFVASNYNPTTGVWADSVAGGPTATSSGAPASLITSGPGTTYKGSPTVLFAGGQYFTLSSSIPVSDYSCSPISNRPATTKPARSPAAPAARSNTASIRAGKMP